MREWMRSDEDVDCSGLSLYSNGLHMIHYDSDHRFKYNNWVSLVTNTTSAVVG